VNTQNTQRVDIQMSRWSNRRTGGQTDKQMVRQIERQMVKMNTKTDRQIGELELEFC
jgi:hypothetical protein